MPKWETQSCFQIAFATPQTPEQRLTVPINQSSVPVSNTVHVGKVIPYSNLGRQKTPCKLGPSTLILQTPMEEPRPQLVYA